MIKMAVQYTINAPSIIGALLIKEGFLTEEGLKRAIDIQKSEIEEIKMPFWSILVKKGFVTVEQIKVLLSHPDVQNDIEAAILESGIIDERQYLECLKKKEKDEPVGELFIREGYISLAELENVLSKKLDGIKIGKLAIRLKMLTEKELDAAFRFKRYKRALGEILCDLNLITLSELNLAFQRHNKRLRLGEILLQQDIIDKNILENVLQEQNHRGETLGMILVRKGLITVDQLYFALSIQYNIPFHNLDGFIFYERQTISLRDIIGQKYAEANLVLPLFLNGNILTVGVSNPSRVGITNELRSFYKHLRINCVLITDEKFEQLFSILYGEMPDPSKTLYMNVSQAALSSEKATISNPETDIPIIERLYEKYQKSKTKQGGSCQGSKELFKEFIVANFNSICDKFHCNRVSFYIDERNEHVEILAAPIVENNQTTGLPLAV